VGEHISVDADGDRPRDSDPNGYQVKSLCRRSLKIRRNRRGVDRRRLASGARCRIGDDETRLTGVEVIPRADPALGSGCWPTFMLGWRA
jgi:hypothetical protein